MQNPSASVAILIVEDNPADLYLLEHMVRSTRIKIKDLYSADHIAKAIELLQTNAIDIVLLDLSLPDSFGIDTFLTLKPLTPGIPVIILTGLSDSETALEAIKQGAQDYLVKGEFNEGLLGKTIQYSVERKRNEEKLRESNERFNMVAKATNDAIWDWNLVTNEVFLVGDTYKRLFGYDVVDDFSPPDLWENSLHPDEKELIISKLQHAIEGGNKDLWEDEYHLQKADGEYAYVHDRGYIIYDLNGKPVRMIGSIQDITERKNAQEAIIASEEKYRQMFYKNPYPAWIYDQHSSQILEVNEAAIKKYGYSRMEFLRLNMQDIRPIEEVSKFLYMVEEPATAYKTREELWTHKKKNGEIMMVEASFYPIAYLGKTAIQVQVNDVTERKSLEKKLAEQQKQKQQQITEAALGAQEKERVFLGEELHDNINQILATSKLYLDVVLEENDPAIELIMKSRENISIAIEEIRKLSKALITPGLKELGLKQSIQELIGSILSVKKIKIKLLAKGVDENMLNTDQKITIYRIVQEQLNNILKYADASLVVIQLDRNEGQVYLSISDNGKGFNTSAPRRGIGLTNITSRAELYNGKVEIDSAPGRGCRLKVVLNSKLVLAE